MERLIYLVFSMLFISSSIEAQDAVTAANRFTATLSQEQKSNALLPFDTDERYNFHFVPKNNRKGIAIGNLTTAQREAAMTLVRTCLSEQATTKVTEIMEMENLLKVIERRNTDDNYRDPNKYYFSIFGVPGNKTIWGWRIEGHHLSFNFSVNEKKLVSGTPGFLGSNPGIVREGATKGKQILKDETDMGFALIHTLSGDALQKTMISSAAPSDILTAASRKAMIENPAGLSYGEMNPTQQQHLLQLIKLYINRFTRLFADDMLKSIQDADLNKLKFAWAGTTEAIEGKAYYYRIQGPTIIIEYDNSQNNANHIHTVVRDLQRDFGGDELLAHYRNFH